MMIGKLQFHPIPTSTWLGQSRIVHHDLTRLQTQALFRHVGESYANLASPWISESPNITNDILYWLVGKQRHHSDIGRKCTCRMNAKNFLAQQYRHKIHTRVLEGHGIYVTCRISTGQLVQRSYHRPITGLAFPFFPCHAGCTPLQMSTLSEVSGGIANWKWCHFSALVCQDPSGKQSQTMKCDKSWHLVLGHCSV